MFKHEKQLLKDVRVDGPNPHYAAMLLEQLGGSNGELKAGLQYISQSFRIRDPEIKDLFLDIGAEEFSHMEMIATTINMLNGDELEAGHVQGGSIQAHTVGGLAPMLTDASGFPWISVYVNVTGDLPSDILSNIAAEQRAKVVYEYLYRQIDDTGVRETIDFLLNREEAHNALFREALRKVQDSGSNIDYGVTEDSKLYFDLSTPGQFFENPFPTPQSFQNPRRQPEQPHPVQ